MKKKLFDVRAKRERPFLDTKIITAWNGLMISAFAKGAAILSHGIEDKLARIMHGRLANVA